MTKRNKIIILIILSIILLFVFQFSCYTDERIEKDNKFIENYYLVFSDDNWEIYESLRKSLFKVETIGIYGTNHFITIPNLCADEHYTNISVTIRNDIELNENVEYENISTMLYEEIEFKGYLQKAAEYAHYPEGYCLPKAYIMFEYNGFFYRFCFNTNCEDLMYHKDNMKIRDDELICYINYIDTLLQNEKKGE